MSFLVTVRKRNVSDRQTDRKTDGGHFNISHPGTYLRATADKNSSNCNIKWTVAKEQNVSPTTVAKEYEISIASISQNDQYILKYICANFHAFITIWAIFTD